MNRREALAIGTSATVAGFINEELGLKSKPLFNIIDDRLSGKIYLSDLNDGEGAYVGSNFFLEDRDGNLYFRSSSGHLYSKKSESNTWFAPIHLIFRKNDNFYVKPDFQALSQLRTAFMQNAGWVMSNAYLAACQAYPLDRVKDGYCVVPMDYQVKLTNPTVRRNVEEFKDYLAKWEELKKRYNAEGINSMITYNPNFVKTILGE